MAITVHLYYTGVNGAARVFAQEMAELPPSGRNMICI